MSFWCDHCEKPLNSRKYETHKGFYLHKKCLAEILAEEDEQKLCVCEHPRLSHDEQGECCAWINDFIGHCPCERFKL